MFYRRYAFGAQAVLTVGIILFCAFFCIQTGAGFASPKEGGADKESDAPLRELWSFAEGAGDWRSRWYGETGEEILGDLTVGSPTSDTEDAASSWLGLPVKLPGKNEFVTSVDSSWEGWQFLEAELWLPADLPDTAEICFFTKNWDDLWRQVRFPVSEIGERRSARFRIPIVGAEARSSWESCGHTRPWHMLTPNRLREFGCSIFPGGGASDVFTGGAFLKRVWLSGPGFNRPETGIRRFVRRPNNARVGEMCEFSFELALPYSDPFSGTDAVVNAEFRRPDGEAESVRGFYFEDFLYNRDQQDKTQALVPYGSPSFRVRYTPRIAGEHTVVFTIKAGDARTEVPEISFTVDAASPEYRGFVRVDPNNSQAFAYDDGELFWGIGMNVRSPYDMRYAGVAPYSNWQNEGLALYDRLFRKYSDLGINIVEVWMSSWWLALEWIHDAPGFHGVGHFNQYRAWMLDHIVRLAEEHGICLILVFNNHGKFGMVFDSEWERNPMNVENGGYLKKCEEYFTDKRAKRDFKRFCDYVSARWGYSPNLMAWKLFTEVDLTGPSIEYYHDPAVAAWHKEMGRYLKSIDIYDHPVTTHWMLGYYRINLPIADLPELDFLTTDAYYQSGGTEKLLKMLRGGQEFAEERGKPLIVTEFGGSPYAASMGNLMKQCHLGIWTGFFCGSPVAPLYWWVALADEKNLYGSYRALNAYTQNENRKGMESAFIELDDTGIMLNILRDETRLLVWGFDSAYYLSNNENPKILEHEDFVLNIPELSPGKYAVEHWNLETARIMDRQVITVSDKPQEVEIEIPNFRLDFVLKMKLQ